jgi:GT2 family glycosyltransferase
VSVILLSHNRPGYLRESLAAAVRQRLRPSEILVVDNHSPASPEVAAVVARFPEARLVANPTNLGFTGGMNVGLREATGDYVVLLEDDIVAEGGCTAALTAYLGAHPEVGLCGGVMLNRRAGTVRCAGGELRLGVRYHKKIFGANEPDEGQYREPFLVSYLPGALMCGRLQDLRRWGGFREDFFMYYEDDELCARLTRAGWRIAVVPGARVEHIDPPPGPCPRWLEYLKLRNFLRLYLLHAPARALPGFLVRYAVWSLLSEGLSRPAYAVLRARALLDALFRLPRLLRDRYRLGPQPPPPQAAAETHRPALQPEPGACS